MEETTTCDCCQDQIRTELAEYQYTQEEDVTYTFCVDCGVFN